MGRRSCRRSVGAAYGFEQLPELEQRRCIRNGLTRQIDADEAADRLAIVDSVFDSFIRQPEAQLCSVPPPRAFQPVRLTTVAFSLRIERFEFGHQRRSWRYCLDLG